METQGKLKGLIRRLVSPIILAGSLTLPFASTNSFADHKNDLQNLRDWYIINEGIRTTLEGLRGFEEHQFHEWIKRNHESYRDNRDYRENSRNTNREDKVNPNKIPQTFIANYWKDFNKDSKLWIEEMVGLNKPTFKDNEPLELGIYLPKNDIAGKSYDIKVFNPKGKLIKKHSGFFERDFIVIRKSLNIEDILRNHGEGTYAVAFYFNDGYWNKKEFKLLKGKEKFVEKITPFVCNSYYESDGVEGIDFDKDTFLGLNKNMYTDDDESLIVGLYLKSDKIKGKSTCIFIDTPSDEDIHWHENPDNFSIVRKVFKTSELLDKYGPGSYEISFSLGNKLLNKRTIKLDYNNPLKDIKVIVEPLGVFKKAPEPY